jgi:hypothetical protein
MHYSKRETNSNRLTCAGKNIGSPMLRLLLNPVAFALFALSALALAGCSDTLSGNDTTFAKVNESYKDTLTDQKKKAVISEMKEEQAEVQKAAGIAPETTASTTPAKKKKKHEAKKQDAAKQQAEAAQN